MVRIKWSGWVNMGSDLVIVDSNPELADISNPQGYIWARRWWVVACDEDYEYTHFHLHKSEESADRLLRRIEDAMKRGEFSPVDSDHWSPRAYYGSRKHDERDMQRADVEAEFGPGSYRPGCPGWMG